MSSPTHYWSSIKTTLKKEVKSLFLDERLWEDLDNKEESYIVSLAS